eukprot:g54279.t1
MRVGRLAATALFGAVCALLMFPSNSALCCLRARLRSQRLCTPRHLFLAHATPQPATTTPVTTQPPSAPVTTQPPSAPVTTQPPSAPVTTQPPSAPVTTQPPSVPDLNLQWNVSDNTTLSLPLEPPSGNLPRRRGMASILCVSCTPASALTGFLRVTSCLYLVELPPKAPRGLLRACFGQHIGPEPLNGLQFANAENLLQVCPPRTGQLVNATGMFTRVRQRVAGLELWNTSSVRWARDMFNGLAPGEEPDISSWDLTCVAEINGCRGLQGRVSEARLHHSPPRPRGAPALANLHR